jgi:hypothetical protein
VATVKEQAVLTAKQLMPETLKTMVAKKKTIQIVE